MHKLTKATILLLILLCTGCGKQPLSTTEAILYKAESFLKNNPDSALILLNEIEEPEALDNDIFAKWCLLYGNVKLEELSTKQIERALEWYMRHGTIKEKAQILLYLGKSLADQDEYDQAMSHYINAYEIAQEHNLYDIAGNASCYMGDLYEQKNLVDKAIQKYRIAAEHFKAANNTKGYVCSLRDLGRDYALSDSLSAALQVTLHADSIASVLNNKNVHSSIMNSLGNIYLMYHEYEKAESCFQNALHLGSNKLPNYTALVELYIQTNSLSKAYEMLSQIPTDNPKYSYNISNFYYQLYKAEGKYQKAMEKLEECIILLDSVVNVENQSKILEIETKYNHLKIQSENNKLKIAQQKSTIISSICVCFALLVLLGYFLYKEKATKKIQKQQFELDQIKYELATVSLELERKKNQLAANKEKNVNADILKNEIAGLTIKYRTLQRKILQNSSVYKKLLNLTKQNIPRNDKVLITTELWKQITEQIGIIYPNLKSYVLCLCPDMMEQEWQYCCFYICGFDGKDEAKLLNLNPNSVRTKHVRFRQRLNITLPPKATLYDYLINNMD